MKNKLVAYPLNEFYAMAEMPLPAIEAVSGEQVPEPQKTLLVHENDMTPTLQKFYNYRIDLELKKKVLNGRFFMREVVLLERRRRPVVFGAIRIHLEMFPEAKYAIGPPVDNGFYYDFDLPRTLNPDDLEQLEARMRKSVKANGKSVGAQGRVGLMTRVCESTSWMT